MTRCALRTWGIVCLAAIASSWHTSTAYAASLDQKGEIKLGVRAYTAARIGSEQTDSTIVWNATRTSQRLRDLTFPVSSAGHLRQNRFFVEAELNHDLARLLKQGFGPLALLNDLPFEIRQLKYNLTFRGEGEGIYDYGPAEYRTAVQFYDETLVPPFNNQLPDIGAARRRLRSLAVERQRLFQAYVEAKVGKLFMRFGRQILAWGETDVFRLLDNINPLDNGFGGFLVPLDERRVPIDMLRLHYYVGRIPWTPFSELFIEAFAAIDDAVAFSPGIPQGSPWQLPNLGHPSRTTLTTRDSPSRTVKNTRGGFQVKFNSKIPQFGYATFGVAHYYTYLDTPAVQSYASGDPGPPPRFFPQSIASGPAEGYLISAIQAAPRVQVTGMTSTFAVPYKWARLLGLGGEPIIRSELAYFRGEARHSQSQLDPFVYSLGQCTSGGRLTEDGFCTVSRRTGDSWNFVLGVDTNQWFRFLNPRQSFLLSTQFFYRHINGAAKRRELKNQSIGDQQAVFDGEVLPVPAYVQRAEAHGILSSASQSIFVHHPVDQYLQTLLVSTSYYSGQVTPSLTLMYDWGGAVVAVPQMTFTRDPFRFTVSYSFLTAGRLKGGSGISLLRDRDNVLFQLEYVI